MGVCDTLVDLLKKSEKTKFNAAELSNIDKNTALIIYGINYNHVLYVGFLEKINEECVYLNPGISMHFAKNSNSYPFVYWTLTQIYFSDAKLFYEIENKKDFIKKFSFINAHMNYSKKTNQMIWDFIETGIVYDDPVYEVRGADYMQTEIILKNQLLSDKEFHNKMIELENFLEEDINSSVPKHL